MALDATPYLYALAALSLSFASFSSIVVLLRQMTGGVPSAHHVLLFRLILESSLTTTAAALLPPLLSLFGLRPPLVWHIAGSVALAVMFAHFASYPYRRRRAAPDRPMGLAAWGNVTLLSCGPALLVFDAVGIGGAPAGAVFVLALYLRLVASGYLFFATFAFFIPPDFSKRRTTPGMRSDLPPDDGS
jgi:hypothetical protein